MDSECPVCEGEAEVEESPGFDGVQVRCARCGSFKISGTAVSMLSQFTNKGEVTVARLSHAIWNELSPDNGMLTSANLPEFAERPLPGIGEQVQILVQLVARALGEDRLGATKLNRPSVLGETGLVSYDSIDRLIQYAVTGGLLETDEDRRLSLTMKGWELIDMPTGSRASEPTARVATSTSASIETVKAHCSNCRGERNAYVRASFVHREHDGPLSSSDTFEVLQCAGCNELSVRKTFWFSEWDSIGNDPLTGEMTMFPGIEVTTWPPPIRRPVPAWVPDLQDNSLRALLQEVYGALNNGMFTLAAIGTRTLLDYTMSVHVGDPPGGFAGKLKAMTDAGRISSTEKRTLEALIDAGNAAAHRAFSPSALILDRIVEAVENFLHRDLVVHASAAEIRAATPPRAQK